jgi:hypothetical protein
MKDSKVSTPTIAALYPPWAQINDRVSTLSRRRDEICKLIGDIDRKTAASHASAYFIDSTVSEITPAARPAKPVSDAARSLLGDLAPAIDSGSLPSSQKVSFRDPRREKRSALATELAAVNEALAVLGPQLSQARHTGSKLMCEAVLPDYRTIAVQLCRALIKLSEAHAAHRAFIQNLSRQGVEWAHLRPVDTATFDELVGDPREATAPVRVWLTWAAEAGHFDSAGLPGEWSVG